MSIRPVVGYSAIDFVMVTRRRSNNGYFHPTRCSAVDIWGPVGRLVLWRVGFALTAIHAYSIVKEMR